jgi:histidine triad (HIT) family protein
MMATIFTRIIDGEIPGTFVWRDDVCVVFLSINPITRGHALVVPREEADHWVDLSPATVAHLTGVAHAIGDAQRRVFPCDKVAVIIAGYEVPHVHVHVFPTTDMAEISFARAATSVDRDDLDAAATALRAELARAGHGAASA